MVVARSICWRVLLIGKAAQQAAALRVRFAHSFQSDCPADVVGLSIHNTRSSRKLIGAQRLIQSEQDSPVRACGQPACRVAGCAPGGTGNLRTIAIYADLRI